MPNSLQPSLTTSPDMSTVGQQAELGSPALRLVGSWSVRACTDRMWSASRVMDIASRLGAPSKMKWEIGICVAELVSNAVKYARGGTLEVHLEEAPRRALHVVMRDSGHGFPSLFPLGSMPLGGAAGRVHSTDAPGLRIGLDSVRRLMDEVAVESQRGVGATVTAVKLLTR